MDIFVAKLNSETKAENLTELFSQYGKVISSKIIMDRITGMSKCYGFIEMENETEGNTAIEHLNNSNFMGKSILAKKSEPRPQVKQTNRFSNDSRNRFDNKEEINSVNSEKNFNRY